MMVPRQYVLVALILLLLLRLNSDGSQAKAFLNDFPRAQSAATAFDSMLAGAGQQYSQQYADLLALSVRQLMGSMDITVSRAGNGGWNISDVKVFMKNMGGIGSDSSGYVCIQYRYTHVR